ncbi:MAG: hypothetical protein ACRD0S_01015 [Acidimicrobiales bacterium]
MDLRSLIEAVDRRGRTIEVAVTITKLDGDGGAEGVILVMEEVGGGGTAPAD